MKYLKIKNSDLEVSRLALGMMRIADMSVEEVEKLLSKAVSLGINLFDHADIYGNRACETLFGKALKRNPDIRSKIYIQTKCGIRPGFYDLSKEHIIASVNGSLNRLNVDYIDLLLLHRPDALMDVEEVALAFKELEESGKVRYFGVSNMNPYQIELLQKHLSQKILFNQLQLSIVHAGMIDLGINVNMTNSGSVDHDGMILDYCRLHDITVQPWSILLASWEEGIFLNHPKYQKLNEELDRLSKKYDVSPAGIALAWLLRHPANMIPIAGTTSTKHLEELSKATEIELSRIEWYDLYKSVNRILP